MSQVTGTITSGSLAGQQVEIELPTVRVPELTAADAPQGDDLLVLYQNGGNTTRSLSLDNLRNYIVTGGNSAALTPVVYGADVEIVITAQMAGQSQVNVPVLAGDMFTLERNFQGQLPVGDYYILPSGGFELRPKDAAGNVVADNDLTGIAQVVNEGDFFIAHVFSLVASTPPAEAQNGLFSGIAVINTDTQLAVDHRGKLIHAAFGSSHGTITLEDIADAPASSMVCIETMITNSFDTKIATRSGQAIYYQNTSQTFLYLGKSESLWALRGDDGWYVLKELPGVDNVGDVSYGYKQKLNTLICRGQEVNRADYPRLWQWVQSLGVSLVQDSVWNTIENIDDALTGTRASYKPYEGCFSYGTGGTNGLTFRLPNLMEKFMRGLRTTTGTDTERIFNNPGGIQADENRAHQHDIKYVLNGTDGNDNGQQIDPNNAPVEDNNQKGTNSYAIQPSGGYESRGINLGLLPLINT